MRRPTRIDQIIPSIIEHDAVSDHTFAVKRVLTEMGFQSEIYAQNIGPGTLGRVKPLSELPADVTDRWLIYQCSIGSPAAEIFARDKSTKLLDYHNITPAELVDKWLPPLGVEAHLGRVQLRDLASRVEFAFADSAFNAAELIGLGFPVCRVVPVLFERAPTSIEPDPQLLERLRAGDVRHWLFVGQVGAHKAQHDIIKALSCYRTTIDENVELHIVGRPMGNAYRSALVRFVEDLGLSKVVHFPGSVSPEALAAYYAGASVFVCCSDHEGFCVPIIEAMGRGVPVVAYGAAAVPATVGDAGLVLEDKSPGFLACAIDEVLSDPELRAELVKRGHAQAALFSLEASEQALRASIEEALTLS